MHKPAALPDNEMTDEVKKKIAEDYKDSVRSQVEKGGHARWGETESLNVVEDLVESMSTHAPEEGFDAIRHYVQRVVNPSAFAQVLEKLPATGFNEAGEVEKDGKHAHPARIVRPARGSGGSRKTDDL